MTPDSQSGVFLIIGRTSSIITKTINDIKMLEPYDKEMSEIYVNRVLDKLTSCCDLIKYGDRGEAIGLLSHELSIDDHPNCFSAYTILERLKSLPRLD